MDKPELPISTLQIPMPDRPKGKLLIIYSGDRAQFLAVRFDAIDLIWKTRGGNVMIRTGGENYILPDAVATSDVDKILEQWKQYCDG